MQPVLIYLNLRRTPAEHRAALEAARRQGYAVALITDKPAEAPADLVEIVIRADTYDSAQVDAAVRQIASDRKIAGVVTWSDRDVEAVSRIAAQLGLPAASPQAARIARNKILMRQALADHPETIPVFARVNSWDDAAKATTETGYPVVLKPTSASGSKGIFTCRNERELRDAYNQLIDLAQPEKDRIFSAHPGELIIEQYLDGTEHSVEGFVHQGQLFVAGVTDKQTSEPFKLETGHLHPSVLPSELLTRVKTLTSIVVSAFGLDNCTFHLECIISPRGTVKLVEAAARVGGDYITSHLVWLASGAPFYDNVIRVATGRSPELSDPYLTAGVRKLVAEVPGVLRGIHGIPDALCIPGVQHIVLEARPGMEIGLPPADFKTSLLGAVIASGGTAQAVSSALAQAVSAITVDIEESA
ncbi:MAG: ATP-grasp domain-containing protein [Trebonia sp.]